MDAIPDTRATQGPAAPLTLMCGEVAGGNQPAFITVSLPGLRGTLLSRPCQGARGGDVHYLSVCGSGLLSRVCVADVAGHGETVAKVSELMHLELGRSVDTIDERRVFRNMDQRLSSLGTRAMTTAALLTYYAPNRRLTIAYAGHPPGWIWRKHDGRWRRLDPLSVDSTTPFHGLPLGSGFGSTYSRQKLAADVGDRILLVTDGVLEAPRPADDGLFGADGVEAVLESAREGSCEDIATALLEAVTAFTHPAGLAHDDMTIFVGEIEPGPPGPVLWHVLKNRLLSRPRRRSV